MDRRGTLIVALTFIIIGGYFLLVNLNVLPSYRIDQLWPGLIVLVGILFWLGFIFSKKHDAGLAFVGTIAVLTGLFFFAFTLNVNLFSLGHVDWSDMSLLWPVFPLIVGIAFVVMWIASRFREWGVLIPAFILLVIGIGGLSFTLGRVPLFQNMLQWWPLLLIGAGILVLIRAIVRPRSK